MRRFLFLALFAASAAHAGPSVDRDIVENLPAEVLSQAAPLDAQIDQLEAAIEAKAARHDRENGNARALKFEVKAAKAQVKADKAALKAARKRDDSAVASAAREAMEASEAALEVLETRQGISDALVDLLDAQIELLETQLDVKIAERQVIYAVGADTTIEGGFDDSKFRKARAKAELKFQKARADVSQAETRFTRAGGEELPDRMTITGTQAPAMGGTPAE